MNAVAMKCVEQGNKETIFVSFKYLIYQIFTFFSISLIQSHLKQAKTSGNFFGITFV
jgi:hypothetical protein